MESPEVVVIGLVVVVSSALGQPVRESIDIERLKPAITADPFVVTEGSDVRWPPGEDPVQLGVGTNLALDPLVSVDDGAVVARFVSRRVGFDVFGSLTLAEGLAVAAHLPFFAFQAGDGSPNAAGLGDLRLIAKWRLRDPRRGLGIALLPEVRLPTHSDAEFSGGARTPAVALRAAIDHRFGLGLRVGANIGVLLQEGTQFVDVQAASELTYSAAATLHLGGFYRPVAVGVDVHGAAGLAASQREELPLEGQLFLQIHPTAEWQLQTGPAIGLVPGYGTPAARFLVALRWAPTRHDRDGDGIADGRDRCPDRAETVNGRWDRDGCPDDDQQLALVRIIVKDAETDAPIERSRSRIDGTRTEPTGRPGVQQTAIEPGEHVMWVRARGYAPQRIDLRVPPGVEVEEIVRLRPTRVRVGAEQLEFEGTVYFEFDSAELVPESHDLLDDIAAVILATPSLDRIRIEGHTDQTGPATYNQPLSEARANAVRAYLVSVGVAEDRLESRGFGEHRPISSQDEKNRRVAFVIVR